MRNFNETIKEYYSGKLLPTEKVEAILLKSTGLRKSLFSRYYQFAGVAAVLLIVFAGLYWQFNQATITQGVLAEIAMNHHKRLDVEVASDQYQVVQEKLDRLDFSIFPDRRDLIENYTLVGGRYCSIHGGLAAQLKVRDKISGELLTLYVTKLTDELEGITPLNAEFDGVQIRLWKENGRFFALAGYKEAPKGR